MFIEQIIEFESRGPGPAGCTCNPKAGYFCDKTKIGKENLRGNLAVKYISEGNVPCFLLREPSQLQNLSKNAWFYKWIASKVGLNNLIFSIGFQILKI